MNSKNNRIVLKSLKNFKKDLPEIKIIEPYKPDEIIECDDKDDFIEIINDDIEKYKSMTTQKLNKMFTIPGYKITKLKGEICLRCIKHNNNNNNDDELLDEIQHLRITIDELKEDNKNIKNAFNELSEQFEFIKQKFLKI